MFEEDEEALTIWRDVVGVDPTRIRKMGAADNFWASGPTGGIDYGGGGGGRSRVLTRGLYLRRMLWVWALNAFARWGQPAILG